MTDTERLEWLVTGEGHQKAAHVSGNDERGWAVFDCSNGLTAMSRGCKTFRDAIDAAIQFCENKRGRNETKQA